MKLAQLSHALAAPSPGSGSRESLRAHLGPRRVGDAAGTAADPAYALQELLNAVQALAHGPFQGQAQVQAAALALAADLERLAPAAAARLCSHAPEHPPASLDLEA